VADNRLVRSMWIKNNYHLKATQAGAHNRHAPPC
jgi:hypothetical protein